MSPKVVSIYAFSRSAIEAPLTCQQMNGYLPRKSPTTRAIAMSNARTELSIPAQLASKVCELETALSYSLPTRGIL